MKEIRVYSAQYGFVYKKVGSIIEVTGTKLNKPTIDIKV